MKHPRNILSSNEKYFYKSYFVLIHRISGAPSVHQN